MKLDGQKKVSEINSMTQVFIALVYWLLSSSVLAHSRSGSADLNCCGQVRLCHSCPREYYNTYTYQYASIYNAQAINENHNFNMNGFLRDSSQYQIQQKAAARHILCSNGTYQLAVPFWKNADGIWIRGSGDYGPGETPKTWTELRPK